MSVNLCTFQGLDMSTCHISESTNYMLRDVSGSNAWRMSISKYEYGYFIVVPNIDNDPEYQYHEGVPADLRLLLDIARSNNCLVLRLYADGEVYEHLTVYNW